MQIETEVGVPIGQLSEAGKKTWEPRLGAVISARIIALVHRRSDEGQDLPPAETSVTHWEYPLVEVCWSNPTSAREEYQRSEHWAGKGPAPSFVKPPPPPAKPTPEDPPNT